ncbi:hypothetical protein DKT75_00825 [Leucothrix arctica]|uniref:DUF998 domain-containing protein n=2 Tax=Leucothrix arctica TaxID=1481894 RepID=A0A317CN88_9GAMM|nr:hypothetical protein DKT75_00825 [Leucothrix arctica]
MVLFVAVICCSTALGAENIYAPGHTALDVFDADGFKSSPSWVQIWVGFMLSTFAVGIFFVWKHALARWAIGGLIASMATGHYTFVLLGLPFLGGSIAIMHIICWTPALILLLINLPFLNQQEPMVFRIWSGVMTGVITFSFIFDVRDAAIYINHVSDLA